MERNAQAGCSLENVVRTRMFVTDIANAGKVMAEHCKVFANIRPAATLVMVSYGMLWYMLSSLHTVNGEYDS